MENTTSHPAAPPGRPPRQPRRTLIAGLVLLVFMLIVRFQAPGLGLPVFFQRLVGLANALLAMLVVVFAIREYGKRWNRLPLPLLGRISTSRMAGAATFLAVCAWWLSPWAPLPAERGDPDLWGPLQENLNMPLLSLDDAELATIVLPTPSLEARDAAARTTATDPFSRALAAIATSRFDDATKLLDQVAPSALADPKTLDLARAQLDCYAARYTSASRRYGELLRGQPRIYDYLVQGTLAAALAGEHADADQRAEQLLEQARTLGRESPRLLQAVNLLAAVRVLEGRFADARQLLQESQPVRMRAARGGDWSGYHAPPLAADVNNAAVVAVLAPQADDPNPAEALAWAKRLWNERAERHGQPREQLDLDEALQWHNLGSVALRQSRFDHAAELLDQARRLRERLGGDRNNPSLAVTLAALAEVSRINADYATADKLLSRAAALVGDLANTDPQRLPAAASRARLEADLGDATAAERDFQALIRATENSLAPRHPYVAVGELQLAELDLQIGRPRDAQKLADEAAALLQPQSSADKPLKERPERSRSAASRNLRPVEAARAAQIAGLAAIRLGDRDLAQRKLDEAGQILGSIAAQQPDEIPSAVLEFAALAAARAELATLLEIYSSAQSDYQEALRLIDLAFGERAKRHPLRAEYLVGSARLAIKQHQGAAAIAPLQEALAIQSAALPAGHPATLATRKLLAEVKEQLGDDPAARKLREQAAGHAAP